jgi:hypothetical protein
MTKIPQRLQCRAARHEVGLPVWPTVARRKRSPGDRSSRAWPSARDRLEGECRDRGAQQHPNDRSVRRGPTAASCPHPAGRDVVSAADFPSRVRVRAPLLCPPHRGPSESSGFVRDRAARRRPHEGIARPRREVAENVLRERPLECIAFRGAPRAPHSIQVWREQ